MGEIISLLKNKLNQDDKRLHWLLEKGEIMGYASYLQDIFERLHCDLVEPVRKDLSTPSLLKGEESIQRIRVFLRECEKIESKVLEYLNLATDPDVDMAYELELERKRNDELEKDNSSLREENSNLRKELECKQGRIVELEKVAESRAQQIKNLMKQKDALESKILILKNIMGM